ncbi:hypothetical protein GCM10010112_90570 [Actinoplanes lobatus]|uniref:Uncharacterized protein n=1 Tax=Actinoplanes lobatus TaxID=113568 RepID=A0A7W7MJP5_9ACTN|nr:hypothetical protein [Actinoplanes lobatus]MBB4752566.1 hypothetical protein [Actinoplanes lobatus]GGN97883.1 hypothetical protein GCM10010112_90570 [Actinoplanes lobatus]GIE45842.1 hypothetical protein Alo02nite_87400 [Actinoplanes lobatus]
MDGAKADGSENPGPATNRRIARTVFFSLLAVVVAPFFVVLKPWQRIGTPATVAVALLAVAAVGWFCLALLRHANARPDWYQARIWTTLPHPPLERTVTTVVCTDLVAPGHFRDFVERLRHALGDGTDVVFDVEPVSRQNTVHVHTPLPDGLAVRSAAVDALRSIGVTRIEQRPEPFSAEQPGPT